MLIIRDLIDAEAAELILDSVKSLREAELHVVCMYYPPSSEEPDESLPTVWKPQADLSHLRHLGLVVHSDSSIDLAGLASATRLQSLRLESGDDNKQPVATNFAALRSLQGLTQLSIYCLVLGLGEQEAAGISALRGLRSLVLPSTDVTLETWDVLAGLPELEELEASVTLGQGSQPMAALRRLGGASTMVAAVYMRLDYEGQGAQLAGCLARQLPQLRELRGFGAMREVALGLRGHSSLQRLHFGDVVGWNSHWPAGLLSSLAAVECLELTSDSIGDGLLADVAQCSRLTLLDMCRGMVTSAGLAVLAAGPCRDSLQRLEMLCQPLYPAEAALLLRGSMAQLRDVVVFLRGPAEGSSGGSKFCSHLADQLRAAGAAGCWSVEGLWWQEGPPACWVCSLERA